jgi:hypothetical protein
MRRPTSARRSIELQRSRAHAHTEISVMHSTISSPTLCTRKKPIRLTKRRIIMYLVISPCLLLLAFLLFAGECLRNARLLPVVTPQPADFGDVPFEPALWPTNSTHAETIYTHRPHNFFVPSFKAFDLLGLPMAEPIPAQSLTALLPITSQSISNLEAVISALLRSPGQLHEVIISCPEVVLTDVRRIIRKSVSAEGIEYHLEFSLRPWVHGWDNNAAIMHVASEVTTDWVLILDNGGLHDMDSRTRDMLLNPKSIPLPTGPRGVTFLPNNISCATSSWVPQPVSFVIPPFVMPYSLVNDYPIASTGLGIWADLGEQIARARLDGIGGIVTGTDTTSAWCHFVQSDVTARNDTLCVPDITTETNIGSAGNETTSTDQLPSIEENRIGTFALLFPSLRNMRLFARAACRLQDNGHIIRVLLYGEAHAEDPSEETTDWEERTVQFAGCRLNYDTLSPDNVQPAAQPILGVSFVSDWLNTFDEWPDVVIALKDQEWLPTLTKILWQHQSIPPSLILIPYADLSYCEWMGSLSIEEWRSQ